MIGAIGVVLLCFGWITTIAAGRMLDDGTQTGRFVGQCTICLVFLVAGIILVCHHW